MQNELLKFKKVWKLTPFMQVSMICLLFVLTILSSYISFKLIGKDKINIQLETLNGFRYFAPIYEEIIFRGFILGTLLKYNSLKKSIIYSSVLFGLWHFKNIFEMDFISLSYQIFYAIFIIGPILAFITIKTKTIWIGVILHFLNNFLSPISFIILNFILLQIK